MIRNERTRALFLSALMVLSVFGGAVAFTGTVAAADSGSDGLDAQSNHTTDWSLDNPDIEVVRGGLAEFDVSFNDTSANEAYLVVGRNTDNISTSYEYEANITIRNDPNSSSDSGTVVLNTYEARNVTGNVPAIRAEGGITVDFNETGDVAGVIQPTTDADGNQVRDPYPVQFGTESLEQAHTNPNMTGGMDLLARGGVNPTLETLTGPPEKVSELLNASGSEIQSEIEDGNLTTTEDAPSNGIANHETLIGDWDALVYEVEAPGIAGFLETEQASVEQTMFNRGALELTQENPFFNQAPKRLNLTNDASGVSVKAVNNSDTYYFVVNVEDVTLERQTNFGRVAFGPPETNEAYDVQFAIDDGIGTLSASDDATQFVDSEFQLSQSNFNDAGQYEIRIRPNFDVTGTSNLPPGTNLRFVLNSKQNSPGSFTFIDNTTVGPTGDFAAEFAPANIPPTGAEFDLEVTAPAFPNAPGEQEDGLFREQPTANVTFMDQTRVGFSAIRPNQTRTGGDFVVINRTDLSDGGYIAIHADNNGAPGEIIGSSKLLSAGAHNEVPIALDEPISENTTLYAMPHFDRPGDGFFNFNGTTGNDSF